MRADLLKTCQLHLRPIFDAEEEQAQLGVLLFGMTGGLLSSPLPLPFQPRTCPDLSGALGRGGGKGGQLFGFLVGNQFTLHLSEQNSIFCLPQSNHLFILGVIDPSYFSCATRWSVAEEAVLSGKAQRDETMKAGGRLSRGIS